MGSLKDMQFECKYTSIFALENDMEKNLYEHAEIYFYIVTSLNRHAATFFIK